MKKTSNARLRRTLAMIAALTILLSGLTACKKAPADTEEPTASTPPTAATTVPTTEAPETTEPKAPTVMGTVNTNNLNIRTSPSSTATIVSQLDAGDRVEILEQRTSEGLNWGRIDKGWISLVYVTLDGQVSDTADNDTKVEEPTTPTQSGTSSNVTGTATNQSGSITATELNIRKGPGTNYDAVGKYKKGDKVTITETKDGWGKTDKGWISLKYVSGVTASSGTTTTTTTDSKNSTLVTNGSTTSLGTVKITIGALNVRYGPGSSYDVVTKVTNGNSYSYYQKSGDWVRIKDGWIYTKGYTDIGGGTTGTATNQTGTVTASQLNIRKGPGSSYEAVGKYYNGDKVTITETKDGWGKTDKGWISMKYVSTSGTTSTTSGTTGTITASSLFIREQPDKNAKAVGGYTKGETVTILETKDGWGRTNKGWISMNYVKTN